MMRFRLALSTVIGALLVVGLCWSLPAQAPSEGPAGKKAEGTTGKRAEGPGGRRGDRGEGPGGPRNFDPEQMRQRMMERMKETLGATDEEWKALSPKLEKVMTAQREARFGGMGFGPGGGRGPFGGGPGGPPGSQDTANLSPLAKATNDLRTTLDDKSASAEDIGKKLTALRQAREKAREDLAKAQKDLRELLTQRQEATLVMMGTLD